jgi:hypothetical protein
MDARFGLLVIFKGRYILGPGLFITFFSSLGNSVFIVIFWFEHNLRLPVEKSNK